MRYSLPLVVLMVVLPTVFADTRVGRVYVNSPLNTGIIFEYANRLIPEESVINNEALACFNSELQKTGLFTTIEITSEPTARKEVVDVHVTPNWQPNIEEFVVKEVIIRGLEDVDDLNSRIAKQGLREGASFLRFPPGRIRDIIREAAKKQADPDFSAEEFAYHLATLAIRVKVVAPRRVEIIISADPGVPCNQR